MIDARRGIFSAWVILAAKCLMWIAAFVIELAIVMALSIAIWTAAFGGLSAITEGAIRISGNAAARPRLVFACCESPDEANGLHSLFTNPAVISDLRELHAEVAFAITDLSAGRADAVSLLNEAGIPVTAWLLLPERQGYYMNSDNAAETAARFKNFEKWTAEHRLCWEAVGLDFEPDVQEFAVLKQETGWRSFGYFLRRYFDGGQVRNATEAYARLIKRIQSSGYPVQTYQLPLIVAERRARSTLLEHLLGIVDVRGNVEVLMLYTSFNPSIGSAMIWKFGPEAQAIALGVVGRKSGLDWVQFSRGLIVAGHFTNLVGVFNLEGCLQQGFLKRLTTMNWEQSVVIPAGAVRKAVLLHSLLPATLWTLSHMFLVVVLVILIDAWLAWRWTRKRGRQSP